MKQLHKYTTILLAFMTILALGIGVYVSCRPDTNDIQLKWGKVTNTGEQWSVSLTEDAHVATLRWTLPDSLPAGTTLAFKSNYMSATFFLEGQPFYTYGESPSSPFQTSFGQAFLTA